MYEKEKSQHAETRTELEKTQADLRDKKTHIETLLSDHEENMAKLNALVSAWTCAFRGDLAVSSREAFIYFPDDLEDNGHHQ